MTINVGELIPNQAILAELPVGAAVTEKGGAKLWTKHGPDSWGRHQGGADRYPEHQVWFAGQRLMSLPGEVYVGPLPGQQVVTMDQLDALPAHSTVSAHREESREQSLLRKNNDASWEDDHEGVSWDTGAELIGEYDTITIASVPDLVGETVEQFAWRFRDIAITGSERARGSANTALGILDKLKSPFRPSVGVVIANQYDKNQLPEGSRLYVGSPEKPETFGLFVKQGERWVRLVGTASLEESQVAVVDGLGVLNGEPATDEPAEWMTRTVTTEDMEKIAHLRAKAWKEGYKKKLENGWCDEFERVMLRGGITAESAKVIEVVAGVPLGSMVTVTQAAHMPLGTFFYHPTERAAYVRAEGSKNKAGTKRAFSFVDHPHHYNDVMVLVGGELSMPVLSHAEMDALPVGAVIKLRDDTQFRKCDNGQWGRGRLATRGEYTSNQFGDPERESYLLTVVPS